MKKIRLFAILPLLMLAMAGCKYEEGPFVSFVPKQERIANTWVVEEVDKNGNLDTEIEGFKEITFFKEGACQIIYNPGGVEFGFTGTWVLNDDKTYLTLLLDDDLTGTVNYESVWTILRLKEDQLKVTYTDGSDVYITTFKTAP